MTRSFKYLTTALWVCCILATATVVLAYLQSKSADAVERTRTGQVIVEPAAPTDLSEKLYSAPAFALQDENEQPVTDQTLKGKPWVAAFIFTECSGTCPMMSRHMANLQTKITNPDVRLVSFTLDPNRDTPAVLKKYAKGLNADEKRWFFLRGTEQQMQDTAHGMKIAVEGRDPEGQIIHSSKFLLVDKDNFIRGIYDGTDATTLDKLAADADKLAKE